MPWIQESHDYIRGGRQKDTYTEDDVVVGPCPLCGAEERERIYTEHGCVGVSRCQRCDLLYTCPRIRAPEEVYWGDPNRYHEEARLIFEGKRAHHRDPNYLEELDLIRRFKPAGRFLDVGCNMGMLLRHAVGMGWECVGVEPSPSLSRLAREKLALTVHTGFLHDLPSTNLFDVIALSDVFEHITEPLAFLGEVRRRLDRAGIVYVKVPNARWNLCKQRLCLLRGRRPSQGLWDSYEHVVHYTDESLRAMLRRGGLKVIWMGIGRPIQTPAWHEFVGHYYQYPTPWPLDWKRQTGRWLFYRLARPQRWLRRGSIGCCAPNIVAVAMNSEEAEVSNSADARSQP